MQRRRMTLLLSLALALLLPLGVAAQPNVTATLQDTPDNDPAFPGDNIQYEAVISNDGTADATGVMYIDQSGSNETTLQSGFESTPLSGNDNFAANANVEIDSGTFSVLANDFDLDGGPVCVAAGGACISSPLTLTSAQGQILGGGEVTIDPDGTFTYNPPPGFTGTDTFTYEILDNEGEAVLDASGIPGATSTVTIQVNGPVIWFVDNTATCPCDGRLTNPFDDLAVTSNSFDVNADDDPGDNIFLATGNSTTAGSEYTGGLTLLNNQRLGVSHV